MNVVTKTAALGGSIALALLVATQAMADATINVMLHDKGMESMDMELSATEAKAGSITFNIASASENFMHEFVVVRSDLAIDAVSYADSQNTEVDESKLTVIGETEGIEPGKAKVLTLNLEPGQYLLLCNEVGHYKAGMEHVLTVVQ